MDGFERPSTRRFGKTAPTQTGFGAHSVGMDPAAAASAGCARCSRSIAAGTRYQTARSSRSALSLPRRPGANRSCITTWSMERATSPKSTWLGPSCNCASNLMGGSITARGQHSFATAPATGRSSRSAGPCCASPGTMWCATPKPSSMTWCEAMRRAPARSPAAGGLHPHFLRRERPRASTLFDLGVAPRRAALDVHRLDIHEFADAVPRKLAAEARELHSPERHSRIGGNHRVDERLPGIELIDELLLLLRVACPNAAAQAKRAVVGQSDRLVEIVDFEDQRHRAEHFLAVRSRGAGDVAQRSREVEVAWTAGPLATGQHPGALFHRVGNLRFHALEHAGQRQRPYVGRVLHWVADLELGDRLDEARDKAIIDGPVNDEALGRDAGLAVVDVARGHRRLDRRFQLRAGKDDEGVAAS